MTNTATEAQIDDFLAHYGVKGMRWGVRKAEESGDGRAKAAAGQPQWGSHVDAVTKNELKAYNRAVESLNKTGLATLNANPKYAGKKINPNSALGRKYQKDAQALFDRTMADKLRNANIRKQLTRTAVTALSLYLGVGLIGTGVNVALMLKDVAGRGAVSLDALQHAADLALPPKAYKFKMTLNDLGQIEKIGELKEVPVPAELKHVDSVDEFLAHYGVKGMRWGVRKRDQGSASLTGRVPGDVSKSTLSGLGLRDRLAWKSAQKYLNTTGLRELNNHPDYKGKKVEAGTPLGDRYERDAGLMHMQAMDRAYATQERVAKTALATTSIALSLAAAGFGISQLPSTESVTITELTPGMTVRDYLAQHVDFDGVALAHAARFKYFAPVVLNELGHVVSVGDPRPYGGELDDMKHIDDVDEFLAHYGVKGMKWGVRKARDAVSSARAKRAAKKQSAEDTEDASSSSSTGPQFDAQKVAAIKAKASKEGLDSLSNAELQALVTRMNLTQQYNKVTKAPSKQEQVRKLIDKQVKNGKTLNDVMAFYNSPAGQLINAMVRSPKAGKHVKIGDGVRVKDLASAAKKK